MNSLYCSTCDIGFDTPASLLVHKRKFCKDVTNNGINSSNNTAINGSKSNPMNGILTQTNNSSNSSSNSRNNSLIPSTLPVSSNDSTISSVSSSTIDQSIQNIVNANNLVTSTTSTTTTNNTNMTMMNNNYGNTNNVSTMVTNSSRHIQDMRTKLTKQREMVASQLDMLKALKQSGIVSSQFQQQQQHQHLSSSSSLPLASDNTNNNNNTNYYHKYSTLPTVSLSSSVNNPMMNEPLLSSYAYDTNINNHNSAGNSSGSSSSNMMEDENNFPLMTNDSGTSKQSYFVPRNNLSNPSITSTSNVGNNNSSSYYQTPAPPSSNYDHPLPQQQTCNNNNSNAYSSSSDPSSVAYPVNNNEQPSDIDYYDGRSIQRIPTQSTVSNYNHPNNSNGPSSYYPSSSSAAVSYRREQIPIDPRDREPSYSYEPPLVRRDDVPYLAAHNYENNNNNSNNRYTHSRSTGPYRDRNNMDPQNIPPPTYSSSSSYPSSSASYQAPPTIEGYSNRMDESHRYRTYPNPSNNNTYEPPPLYNSTRSNSYYSSRNGGSVPVYRGVPPQEYDYPTENLRSNSSSVQPSRSSLRVEHYHHPTVDYYNNNNNNNNNYPNGPPPVDDYSQPYPSSVPPSYRPSVSYPSYNNIPPPRNIPTGASRRFDSHSVPYGVSNNPTKYHTAVAPPPTLIPEEAPPPTPLPPNHNPSSYPSSSSSRTHRSPPVVSSTFDDSMDNSNNPNNHQTHHNNKLVLSPDGAMANPYETTNPETRKNNSNEENTNVLTAEDKAITALLALPPHVQSTPVIQVQLQQLVSLRTAKIEIERIKNESYLASLKQEVSIKKVEDEEEANHLRWIAQQKRIVREARVRRALANELGPDFATILSGGTGLPGAMGNSNNQGNMLDNVPNPFNYGPNTNNGGPNYGRNTLSSSASSVSSASGTDTALGNLSKIVTSENISLPFIDDPLPFYSPSEGLHILFDFITPLPAKASRIQLAYAFYANGKPVSNIQAMGPFDTSPVPYGGGEGKSDSNRTIVGHVRTVDGDPAEDITLVIEIQRITPEGEPRSIGWTACPLFRKLQQNNGNKNTSNVSRNTNKRNNGVPDETPNEPLKILDPPLVYTLFGHALRLPLFRPPVGAAGIALSVLQTLPTHPSNASVYIRLYTHEEWEYILAATAASSETPLDRTKEHSGIINEDGTEEIKIPTLIEPTFMNAPLYANALATANFPPLQASAPGINHNTSNNATNNHPSSANSNNSNNNSNVITSPPLYNNHNNSNNHPSHSNNGTSTDMTSVAKRAPPPGSINGIPPFQGLIVDHIIYDLGIGTVATLPLYLRISMKVNNQEIVAEPISTPLQLQNVANTIAMSTSPLTTSIPMMVDNPDHPYHLTAEPSHGTKKKKGGGGKRSSPPQTKNRMYTNQENTIHTNGMEVVPKSSPPAKYHHRHHVVADVVASLLGGSVRHNHRSSKPPKQTHIPVSMYSSGNSSMANNRRHRRNTYDTIQKELLLDNASQAHSDNIFMDNHSITTAQNQVSTQIEAQQYTALLSLAGIQSSIIPNNTLTDIQQKQAVSFAKQMNQLSSASSNNLLTRLTSSPVIPASHDPHMYAWTGQATSTGSLIQNKVLSSVQNTPLVSFPSIPPYCLDSLSSHSFLPFTLCSEAYSLPSDTVTNNSGSTGSTGNTVTKNNNSKVPNPVIIMASITFIDILKGFVREAVLLQSTSTLSSNLLSSPGLHHRQLQMLALRMMDNNVPSSFNNYDSNNNYVGSSIPSLTRPITITTSILVPAPSMNGNNNNSALSSPTKNIPAPTTVSTTEINFRTLPHPAIASFRIRLLTTPQLLYRVLSSLVQPQIPVPRPPPEALPTLDNHVFSNEYIMPNENMYPQDPFSSSSVHSSRSSVRSPSNNNNNSSMNNRKKLTSSQSTVSNHSRTILETLSKQQQNSSNIKGKNNKVLDEPVKSQEDIQKLAAEVEDMAWYDITLPPLTGKTANPFDLDHGAFDIYIDGARFLPDNVTISKMVVKLMDPSFAPLGPTIETVCNIDSDLLSPTYTAGIRVLCGVTPSQASRDIEEGIKVLNTSTGKMALLRIPGTINPACTLLIRIDTVEKYTGEVQAVGYSVLNPFSLIETVEISTSLSPVGSPSSPGSMHGSRNGSRNSGKYPKGSMSPSSPRGNTANSLSRNTATSPSSPSGTTTAANTTSYIGYRKQPPPDYLTLRATTLNLANNNALAASLQAFKPGKNATNVLDVPAICLNEGGFQIPLHQSPPPRSTTSNAASETIPSDSKTEETSLPLTVQSLQTVPRIPCATVLLRVCKVPSFGSIETAPAQLPSPRYSDRIYNSSYSKPSSNEVDLYVKKSGMPNISVSIGNYLANIRDTYEQRTKDYLSILESTSPIGNEAIQTMYESILPSNPPVGLIKEQTIDYNTMKPLPIVQKESEALYIPSPIVQALPIPYVNMGLPPAIQAGAGTAIVWIEQRLRLTTPNRMLDYQFMTNYDPQIGFRIRLDYCAISRSLLHKPFLQLQKMIQEKGTLSKENNNTKVKKTFSRKDVPYDFSPVPKENIQRTILPDTTNIGIGDMELYQNNQGTMILVNNSIGDILYTMIQTKRTNLPSIGSLSSSSTPYLVTTGIHCILPPAGLYNIPPDMTNAYYVHNRDPSILKTNNLLNLQQTELVSSYNDNYSIHKGIPFLRNACIIIEIYGMIIDVQNTNTTTGENTTGNTKSLSRIGPTVRIGWTLLPLFDMYNDGYLNYGMFRLPIYCGVPNREILDTLLLSKLPFHELYRQLLGFDECTEPRLITLQQKQDTIDKESIQKYATYYQNQEYLTDPLLTDTTTVATSGTGSNDTSTAPRGSKAHAKSIADAAAVLMAAKNSESTEESKKDTTEITKKKPGRLAGLLAKAMGSGNKDTAASSSVGTDSAKNTSMVANLPSMNPVLVSKKSTVQEKENVLTEQGQQYFSSYGSIYKPLLRLLPVKNSFVTLRIQDNQLSECIPYTKSTSISEYTVPSFIPSEITNQWVDDQKNQFIHDLLVTATNTTEDTSSSTILSTNIYPALENTINTIINQELSMIG